MEKSIRSSTVRSCVSILVLMDVSFKHRFSPYNHSGDTVSILVLMEVSFKLKLLLHQFQQAQIILGFNPCFNGSII